MNPVVRENLEHLLGVPEEERGRILETLPPEVREEILTLLRFDTQTESHMLNLMIGNAARGFLADAATKTEVIAGGQFGPYQVEDVLGAGGMGMVYRARDTRLHRTVALKVLPSERMADPAWKLRFLNEARAASALNHPNIITLYDIANDHGIDFLVFESVPGKTLKELITAKGLLLENALAFATQIANALSAAHAAGIVHRDIKPGNVIITAESQVKVLDFGLAKLQASPQLTALETAHTASGVVMGTAAYMSPEQAAGCDVDHRTDIFSLGVVLFEMLCGVRPFGGSTQVDILHAILNSPVPSVASMNPDIAPEMDEILSKALAKGPRERYCHAGDFELDLRRFAAANKAHELPSQRFSAARSGQPGFPSLPWLAVVVLLALVAGGALSWRLKPEASPRAAVLTRLTTDAGLTTDPTISADGKLLAYASDRGGEDNLDIWVQHVPGGEPVRLTRDPAEESEPSFSPDGSMIAFRSERDGGGIYVMPSLGGAPRRIADGGRRPRWSPDGSQIAYWTGQNMAYLLFPAQIHIIGFKGGESRAVQPGMAMARWPVWSRDGRYLLFLGAREAGTGIDWYTAPVDGGPAIATGAHALLKRHDLAAWLDMYFTPAVWNGPGDGVLFTATLGDSTNIWQVSVPPGGRATGTPRRLTFGAGIEVNPSLTAGGTLAYSTLSNNIDLWALPMNTFRGKTGGPLERLTQDPAVDYYPAVSSDGKTLTYMSTRSGSTDLWVQDVKTGSKTVAAAEIGPGQTPIIARDGSRLLFGGPKLGGAWYSLPLLAGEVVRPSARRELCDQCWPVWDLSSDGRWLLYDQQFTKIMAVRDMASGRTSELVHAGPTIVGRARISPDTRWVAFNSSYGVFLIPFRPEMAAADQASWIPLATGENYIGHPQWSLDSRMVYYFSSRDGRFCIWAQRIDRATGRPEGQPFAAAHFHQGRISLSGVPIPMMGMAIAPDRIILNLSEMSGNVWMAQTPGK
jgi:eukaryotic-like serine/threonine-protein kinase